MKTLGLVLLFVALIFLIGCEPNNDAPVIAEVLKIERASPFSEELRWAITSKNYPIIIQDCEYIIIKILNSDMENPTITFTLSADTGRPRIWCRPITICFGSQEQFEKYTKDLNVLKNKNPIAYANARSGCFISTILEN